MHSGLCSHGLHREIKKVSVASLSQCEMVFFIVLGGKDILIQFLLKAAPLSVNF